MTDSLPAPLVPAEVDLRGLEYMPLLGGRLFNSDFNLDASDTEFRVGLRLWWAAWNQVPAGSLPSEDQRLCKLAGLEEAPTKWRKVRAVALHGFVKCSDGRLYHPIVAQQAMIAWEKRGEHQQSKAGDAERKARERADRSAMFAKLRAAGVTPAYDTKTAELRRLVTQHVTAPVTADVTQPVTVTVTAKTGRDVTGQIHPPMSVGENSTTVDPPGDLPTDPGGDADPRTDPPPLPGDAAGKAVAPPPPPPPSGDPDQMPSPSLAGRACMACRGANVHDVNPSHPDLLRLLAAGVTPEDIGATAAECAAKGRGRFAYVLATVESRRAEAAARGAIPAAAHAGPLAWAEKRSEVVNVGAGLGIVWEEVDRSTGRAASWPAYRSKVIAAWSAKHGVAA